MSNSMQLYRCPFPDLGVVPGDLQRSPPTSIILCNWSNTAKFKKISVSHISRTFKCNHLSSFCRFFYSPMGIQILNSTIKSLQSNTVHYVSKRLLRNNLGLFQGWVGECLLGVGWEPKVRLKCKDKIQLKGKKKMYFKVVCQNPRVVKILKKMKETKLEKYPTVQLLLSLLTLYKW